MEDLCPVENLGSTDLRLLGPAYGVALGLTVVIEIGVYLLCWAACGWVRGRTQLVRAIALVLGVNLITHPLLWSVVLTWPAPAVQLVGEIGVVLVEGLLIWVVLRPERNRGTREVLWCWWSALLANACSVLLGWLLLAPLVNLL